MTSDNLRKCIAECMATFALVLCGTGAIIINEESGGLITPLGISISFGLIVTVMIYALGKISGSHMNPAVSVALVFLNKLPGRLLLSYIVSQVTGAILASFVLRLIFPGNILLGATLPADSVMQSFILEFLMTFILMLVIINTGRKSKLNLFPAEIMIGAVVGLEAFFGGPVSGASMNPARSFAPAIISGHTEYLWVYLVATVLGAVVAAKIYILFRTPNEVYSQASVDRFVQENEPPLSQL